MDNDIPIAKAIKTRVYPGQGLHKEKGRKKKASHYECG
jgi:hypothetical protein